MRLRVLRQRRPRGPQRPLGRRQVARLAQQMPHAQQHAGGDAVAGGRGVVGEDLGAVDERFVIVGGEVEAARFGVSEVP